ncbi:MAG: PH domain-containing protein [Pseudonocardiales bacterium]
MPSRWDPRDACDCWGGRPGRRERGSLVARRRVRWGGIASLRLRKKAKLSAILTDGAELPLPAARSRPIRACSPLPAAAGCLIRLPTIPMGQRSVHAGPAIPRHDPRPQRRRCSRAVASHRDG